LIHNGDYSRQEVRQALMSRSEDSREAKEGDRRAQSQKKRGQRIDVVLTVKGDHRPLPRRRIVRVLSFQSSHLRFQLFQSGGGAFGELFPDQP